MVPIADRTVKVTLVAQASGYVAGMDQAARKTREVGSEAQKLAQKADGLRVLGTVGVAVGVAILGMGAAALKTGIEYNTLQQTTRKALSTILGSASAAADQMDRLDAFARTSPFAKQVFLKAQQQMLAFGIETRKVIPYMDALQNAVAAAGGGGAELSGLVTIMSKIQSSAKITGIDLLQFGNYGINAAELIGESMGKTGAQIRTEITAGTIDATAALDALASGMATKFAGAAEGMKETFAGSTDRMKAAWRDFGSELARPLVNPDGGGILIDLFNQTADLMRGFIALPEPVKLTTSAIVGTVGVVALLGGAALLAVPKIAAFKLALVALNITGAATKANLSLLAGATKSVLSNPWTYAFIAAALAVSALSKTFSAGAPDADEMTNALKSTADAAKLLEVAATQDDASKFFWGDFSESLEDIQGLLAKINNDGWDWLNLTQKDRGAKDAIDRIGQSLGTLAGTDLPAAQKQFKGLTEQYNLNREEQLKLLNTMPGYKSALTAIATEQGVNVTTGTELQNTTNLLKFAMGGGKVAAELNSAALSELSGKAQSANYDISGLSKTIQGFGKAQLDVNSTTRAFEAAIDAASDAVKENGKTLDVGTAAGRANGEATDAIAVATFAHVSALVEQNASQEVATAALLAGREAYIESKVAAGMARDEAEKYADQLKLTPEAVTTAFEVNTDPAELALRSFYNRWNGKTINLRATGSAQMGSGILGNHQGGLYERGVKAFASGGFASGIYAGVQGGIHKFAEKEMGVPWEAYISGRASDRERNIGLWAETGRRLGAMQSAPYRASAPAAVSAGDSSGVGLGDSFSSEWSDAAMQKFGRIVASNVRQEVRQGMI